MDRAPDDIFALYSHFDLDGEGYRVFERSDAALKRNAATATRQPLKDEIPAFDSGALDAHVASASPARPEPAGKVEKAQVPIPIDIRTEAQKTASASLRNLFRYVTAGEAANKVTHDSVITGSVSVSGSAGGAGATTVTATLARLLSRTGSRCVIVNGNEDSALPVYFGVQRLPDENCRFSGLQSLFEPKIRILDAYRAGEKGCSPNELTERVLNETGGAIDCLILDQPTRCTEPFGPGLRIFVAVPDISSLIGAKKMLTALKYSGDSENTVCVLNRFTAGNVLHERVRTWYSENFSEVVTLADSPVISEALAEGTTVVDWMPHSDVARDFGRLFETVRRKLDSATQRLALCA
jgi:MinD-like ATPase involved in chromosome partitioning or flagellar assembly